MSKMKQSQENIFYFSTVSCHDMMELILRKTFLPMGFAPIMGCKNTLAGNVNLRDVPFVDGPEFYCKT